MRRASKLPPAPLARLAEKVRAGLSKLHRRSVPPELAILELVMMGWISQAIEAAARLGIADALADGPRSAEQVGATVGAEPQAVQRLLRALAQYDLFVELPDGRFAQSALSACLRRDAADGSARAFAMYVGSPQHRAHWSGLTGAVRTGEPSIPALRGMPFFAYLQAEPELGRLFNEAMTGLSKQAVAALLDAYDFSPFRTIVDVGGGHGQLLAGILGRARESRGTLFDLPEVVRDAPELLAREGVADRCTVESGSFWERIPKGGDAYLLKQIVHDWSDAEATSILKRVRGVIRPGAVLLLIESVVPEGPGYHLAKLFDLEMLLSVGGRERTEREFRMLLKRAGFTLLRVVDTAAPISLLEARPV